MSLIHWDKSVLSFHLKEIVEDGQSRDLLGIVGLSAIALGTIAFPALTKVGRPLLKKIIKQGILIYEDGKDTAKDIVAVSVSQRELPQKPSPEAISEANGKLNTK
ncbi:MAG: hypothetical protein QNJ54_32075 [Prochloraceae cyanobacterium]|nr:hypothetical protein [Prochloraceae cyanobacterium]